MRPAWPVELFAYPFAALLSVPDVSWRHRGVAPALFVVMVLVGRLV